MADDAGEVKPEGNAINLVVRDQQGAEVHFKVKRSTKIGKVMAAYCAKKELQQNAVKFIFDGNRVLAEQTPEELEMEDQDTIDCVIEQLGG